MKAGIEFVQIAATSRGAEAARICPLNAVSALLDWPLPPDDFDDAILPDAAVALSTALAACGRVAFRYDDPLAGAEMFLPPQKRSIIAWGLGLAGFGPDIFGIAVASEPAIVAALFAYGGWSHAIQAALVFDPAADPAPVLAGLRQGLDWRRRALPAGARLLFGPGHDGAFGVIAAADPVWLARFEAALESP